MPSEVHLSDADQAEHDAEAKDTFDAAFEFAPGRDSAHLFSRFTPSHAATPSTDFPKSVSHETHPSNSTIAANPWVTAAAAAHPHPGISATRQLAGPSPAGQTVFRGDGLHPAASAGGEGDDGASELCHTMSYYGLGSEQGRSTSIQVGTPKSAMAGVFARQQQRDGHGAAH